MTRTSETHPIEVHWLDTAAHPGPGRIGLTFAPGKRGRAPVSGVEWQRDLAADLDRLREHHGVDLLLSLMEPFEYSQLEVPHLFTEARARGIEVVHLPIVDGRAPAPDQDEAVDELVSRARRAVAAGDDVVIHCRGGIGRTGTVAAMLLTTYGHDAAAAIATVRLVQPQAVESEEQQAYVERFAADGARSAR